MCKANGNPPPKFSIVTGSLEATIPIRESKVKPSVIVDTPLEGLDYDIVKLMSSNPSISIPRIAEELKVTERTIYRHTSKLVKRGVIKHEGSDRSGLWIASLK